jgi:hypothetical protein
MSRIAAFGIALVLGLGLVSAAVAQETGTNTPPPTPDVTLPAGGEVDILDAHVACEALECVDLYRLKCFGPSGFAVAFACDGAAPFDDRVVVTMIGMKPAGGKVAGKIDQEIAAAGGARGSR